MRPATAKPIASHICMAAATVDKLMKRGNFGLERYEKKELLERVAKSYERVWENKKLPLVIINGDNDKNELYEIILSIVQKQI